MKIALKITALYLNFVSYILPKHSGKVAFNIFQTVRLKKIKNREQSYYKQAKHFSIKLPTENLKCYEFGKSENPIVFLVHGWESNAGSLNLFALALLKLNYRVIGFDLPAHATHKENKNNIALSKDALKKLITYINPKEPFSIIGHSFGAAVIAFALSEIKYKVNKVVFLSSNNKLLDIFKQYQLILGFNDKVFKNLVLVTENYTNQSFETMTVVNRMNKSKFNSLLIIHDKFDKVIPFKNAIDIQKKVKNSILIPFEKIGHYRMLWNKEVVDSTIDFITN